MQWLLLSLSIIFIILSVTLWLLIFFGVIRIYEEPNTILDEFLEQVSLQNGWSTSAAVQGDRAGCFFYNTFSLETAIVDALPQGPDVNKLPSDLACNDGFSKPLSKKYHICEEDRCAGTDGKIYLRGDREDFYVECADLSNCPNGLSGVIFDPQEQKWCLANNNGTLYVTPCPQIVTPQDNTFFAIDYAPLGADFSALRIRLPGQDLCFLDDLTIAPCLNREDKGYSWLYVPKLIVEDERYPPGTIYYPPQILEYPTELDLEIIRDNNDLVLQLSQYRSLQTNGDSYYLGKYDLCTTVLGPLEPNCQVATDVISAYNWSQIFN